VEKKMPAPRRAGNEAQKREWVRLMLELADLDRDAFRELRAQAWARVQQRHGEKSPEQIAAWLRSSS
jgi:hypothetical protein